MITPDAQSARLTLDLVEALFDDGPGRIEKRRAAAMAIERVAPGALAQMQATIDLDRVSRLWRTGPGHA